MIRMGLRFPDRRLFSCGFGLFFEKKQIEKSQPKMHIIRMYYSFSKNSFTLFFFKKTVLNSVFFQN